MRAALRAVIEAEGASAAQVEAALVAALAATQDAPSAAAVRALKNELVVVGTPAG